MRAAVLLLALGLPAAAAAQTVAPSRVTLAPWWMEAPVTPSIGSAQVRLRANRASIDASFQVVDENSAEATRLAADKIANLGAQLRAFGAEKARVETSFYMEPIYEQYRDKSGTLNDNERADKIERYKVEVSVSIEVRDLTVLEDVYSTVLASRPTRMGQVRFRLEADSAATTALQRSAVADARERARRAAQATGSELGDVKLIDIEDQDEAELTVSPALVERYRKTLAAYRASVLEFCNKRGIGYLFASTQTPFDRLVLTYFRQRGLLR